MQVKAYVEDCQSDVAWALGYRFTVAIVDADDEPEVLDFIDFMTMDEAEAYAEGFNEGQAYADR